MSRAQLPNVLLVMADQQKANARHLYGSPFCHTPALERPAQEGLLCEPGSSSFPSMGQVDRIFACPIWKACPLHGAGTLKWREAEGRPKMLRSQRWKFVHDPLEDRDELYDLINDPWELQNMAGVPGYQDILVELSASYRGWCL
jgi:hypothetical protein